MAKKKATPPKFSDIVNETPATLRKKSEAEIREEFRVLRRHVQRRQEVFKKHGDLDAFPIKGKLPTMRGMDIKDVKKYVLDWGEKMRKKSSVWSNYRSQLTFQGNYWEDYYDLDFEKKTDKRGREYYTEKGFRQIKDLKELIAFAKERYGDFYSLDSDQIIEAYRIGRAEGYNLGQMERNLDELLDAAAAYKDISVYGVDELKRRGGKTWEETDKMMKRFSKFFGDLE